MLAYTYEVDGESVVMEDAATRSEEVKTVNELMKGTWKYGDFGKAHDAVAEATGKTINDVEMILWGGYLTVGGVLGDNGKKIKECEKT